MTLSLVRGKQLLIAQVALIKLFASTRQQFGEMQIIVVKCYYFLNEIFTLTRN